jgi:hypothetical protein
MAKVVSSYAAVNRGVSEQVPQDRHPGQHYEQVNMVSDPVRGIARRHGSIMMDEKQIVAAVHEMTADQQAYARNCREYSFFVNGTEYSLVYMSKERASSDTLPFCVCFNKDTGKFLNVVQGAAAGLAPWRFGGVSAVTTVGQFVVLASASLGPGYSTVDQYAASSQEGVGWVRGGQYSRTYTMKYTRATDGSVFTASYTTLAASYPQLLDTSDIPLTLPDGTTNKDYQKQVNDRVNAYNSAVNKWTGDAAASIQPQNIAQNLAVQVATTAGIGVIRVGGTICMSGLSGLSCDDGGDGSLFRAVYNTVDDVSKLSAIHAAGKVVKVQAPGVTEPYYMQAKGDTGTGFGTVTWVEGAAQVVTPGQVFALGCVSADGKTFYLGGSPAELATLSGQTVPGYAASACGDITETGAVPYFFGKRITMLTVFMDRLVIVSNGVIFMSRTGDYFNFFRKSLQRVDDDDPIEVYALGAEDDVITRCVTYNKDLFMFGERKQYTISGRQTITPQTVAVSITANERDSEYAQPVVAGNLIFYGKYESTINQDGPSPFSGQVSQFQLGYFQDTPETYRISPQLDRYIRGRPIEFATLASPNALFVRTDGLDTGIYVYSYIDAPGSQVRQFDAWSRWEWDTAVGNVIGMSAYKASLFVFSIRTDGTSLFAACDQFVLDSDVAAQPYLDAQRSFDHTTTGTLLSASPAVHENTFVAVDGTQPQALLGEDFTDWAMFKSRYPSVPDTALWAGFSFDAYFDLTPPYVRDQNDKAVVNGRLVIGRYTVSVTETGGLDAYLTSVGNTVPVFGFNGRRVGQSNNQVGLQPVSDATLNVPCGRSNTEHRLRLQARKWLPMAISAIEWVGQFFNNARRV